MPPIFRFYALQVAIGFAAAAAFVGMLLWLDVAGLAGLIARSPDGWLALGMLWVFNGIVFAGAQAGIAVFLMAEDEGGGGRRERMEAPAMLPIPVEARALR